jgi:thiol-disulfide isomerase/thioredoxin
MTNKFFKIVLFGLTIGMFLFFHQFKAHSEDKVSIHLFWGKGCPHCEHEKSFLNQLKQRYPEIEVHAYEVWYNPKNKALYERLAKAYDKTSGSVPATFINRSAWIGFNSKIGMEIESTIQKCRQTECTDPLSLIEKAKPVKPEQQTTLFNIPIFGTFDAAKMSLPVLTMILGALDGFNPCAFFVLLTLLSLLVYAKSRARMLLVGGIFVFFSGFVYFLFMAAWLNLFMIVGKMDLITVIAGSVAIFIALINIKDYFVFKRGISLTIPDKAKPVIYGKMRNIMQAGTLTGIISGTVILAILANMYELLCTAGFPMVFTRVLTLHHLPPEKYYFYLFLYNVIYVIPLAVIVIIFTYTLGARKMTEEEGRFLKLISGLMMLGLGFILIINPALLNNILVTVIFIFAVLIIAGLIVFFKGKSKP